MYLKIIKQCQDGDEQAKLDLINEFNPSIEKYTKKFYSDDIRSELIIKLLTVVNTIDITKFQSKSDIDLSKYLKKVIRNKYIDLVKKATKTDEIEFVYDFMENIGYEDNRFKKSEMKLEIEELLSYLTEKQRKIIIAKYIDDKSLKQISQEYNLSTQTISNTN